MMEPRKDDQGAAAEWKLLVNGKPLGQTGLACLRVDGRAEGSEPHVFTGTFAFDGGANRDLMVQSWNSMRSNTLLAARILNEHIGAVRAAVRADPALAVRIAQQMPEVAERIPPEDAGRLGVNGDGSLCMDGEVDLWLERAPKKKEGTAMERTTITKGRVADMMDRGRMRAARRVGRALRGSGMPAIAFLWPEGNEGICILGKEPPIGVLVAQVALLAAMSVDDDDDREYLPGLFADTFDDALEALDARGGEGTGTGA